MSRLLAGAARVPSAALLTGVAFLFAEFVLEYPIGYALAGWRGLPLSAAGPAVGVMVGLLVAVIGVTVGALLLVRGRPACSGVQTVLGAISPLAFAAIFLVAVMWDVLTSSDGITNGDSHAFPRDGRVLLYLGYTMVASSVLLYAASVRVTVSGALSADALSTGDAAALGLLFLGIPMVVLGFILRFGRGLPGAAAGRDRQRTASEHRRAWQRTGSGPSAFRRRRASGYPGDRSRRAASALRAHHLARRPAGARQLWVERIQADHAYTLGHAPALRLPNPRSWPWV